MAAAMQRASAASAASPQPPPGSAAARPLSRRPPRPRGPGSTPAFAALAAAVGAVLLIVVLAVHAGIATPGLFVSVAIGGADPEGADSTPPPPPAHHGRADPVRGASRGAPPRGPPAPQPPAGAGGGSGGGAGGARWGGGCVRLSVHFPPDLASAWLTFKGEKGVRFPGSSAALDAEAAAPPCGAGAWRAVASGAAARVGFWGKSSQRLRLTRRRSLDVTLTQSPLSGIPGAPPLRRFLLMSMWEDEHRLAYITAARLLAGAGLWLPFVRFVELRCVGPSQPCQNTLGLYLLIEFPTDAIERQWTRFGVPQGPLGDCMRSWGAARALPEAAAKGLPPLHDGEHPIVGARVWRYDPKPAYYDVIDFPSFASNSSLSPIYRRVDRKWKKNKSPLDPTEVLVMDQYLTWLAFNSLLRNGDYDDEVYLVGHPRARSTPLLIHPWDYDTIFQPCHKDGKFAVRNQPLFYCAESDVDKMVTSTPRLLRAYKQSLLCVLRTSGRTAAWERELSEASEELLLLMSNPRLGGGASSAELARVSYEGKAVPDFAKGAAALRGAYRERHEQLRRLLAADPEAAGNSYALADSGEGGAEQQQQQQQEAAGEGAVAAQEGSDVGDSEGGGSEGGEPGQQGDLRACGGLQLKGLRGEYKGRGTFEAPPGARVVVHSFADGGGDPTSDEPDSSGRRFPMARPVSGAADMRSGLHCVQGPAPNAPPQCGGSLFQAVVVRDRTRGSAEWGVPPFVRPSAAPPQSPLPAGARLAAVAPGSLRGAKLGWWPLVLRVVDSGERWLRATVSVTLSGSTHPVPYGVAAFIIDSAPPPAAPGPGAVGVATIAGGGSALVAAVSPVRGGAAPTLSVAAPADGAGSCRRTAPPRVEGAAEWGAGGCLTVVRDVVTVAAGAVLTVGAGAVVLLGPGARLVVAAGGVLRIRGRADDPAFLLPEHRRQWWGGVQVDAGGSFSAEHAVVVGTGGRQHRREKGTGKHRPEVPALTLGSAAAGRSGGRGRLSDVAFVECDGPGFGAGAGAALSLTRVLMQGVQQGGECVRCDANVTDSAVIDVPNRNPAYVDGDNDGLYFSGGQHRVTGSVIAFTADDGIDSGTPDWRERNGGVLQITGTIIDGCQHEGVALSGVSRRALIADSVVRRCQQGVEMGYSLPTHIATLSRSLLEENDVAVRYGDNYHSKTSAGRLDVRRSVLTRSRLADVLNFCRKQLAPSPQLSVYDSVLGLRARRLRGAPYACLAASFTGSGNAYGRPVLEAGRLRGLVPAPEGGADGGIPLSERGLESPLD
eukprot:TRINITY_DN12511_c0_g1_i1.p1 TRINITY_DN12511_c0_g1~~TRINITY_DN12511_c0_g1_i1.p1  ORF type:complete len:1306 (+),score=335.57 TRINITY_DN12511_c0_g1_i1:77-3919(+)